MQEKITQFYYKKSRMQQLKGFCYTVQQGSSKAAAEKMGLDASSISLQIKSLEEDLEVKLFDRVGKKLVLNSKGKDFYERAIKCLQSVDGLFEDFLLADDEKYQNTINIAGFDLALAEIVKYIKIFKQVNPNIKFSLHNINKTEAIRGIIDRKIDLAIYPFWFTEDIPSELERFELLNYKSYWIMSKEHRLAEKDEKNITKKDIANSNFVYIPEQVTMKGFKNFIDEYKIKNEVDIVNANIDMLKSLVEHNGCVTILAGIYMNKKDRETFICKDTENFFPKRFYGCVVNKNRKQATKEFIDLVFENTHIFNN